MPCEPTPIDQRRSIYNLRMRAHRPEMFLVAALTPQLLGGNFGSFGERGKLRPDDRGMNFFRGCEGCKTAIGSSDYILAANNFGKAHKPLGNELGMLDQHRRVRDHARYNDLPWR